MSGPIRILHLVLNLKVGGLERVVLNLVEGLDTGRYQSIVVCLDELGSFGEAAQAQGRDVRLIRKRPGIDWAMISTIRRLVRTKKIDVIHTHGRGPHFYGALAGWLAGVPVVHSKHGRDYPDQPKEVLFNRFCAALTRVIVAVSKDVEDVLRNVEKVSASKIRVITNGISLAPAQGINRADLGLSADDFVIGTVARLSSEKDHQTMILAVKKLAEKHSNVKLVLVGDGPCRQELEKLARELLFSEKVLFLGFRSDVRDVLKVFDVFLLTSITEGTCLALLEAMAQKIPCVATRVGGNPEVLANHSGVLVPAKDPEAIAAETAKVVENQPLRAEIAANGFNRIKERYSVEAMVAAYAGIYDSLRTS